LDDFKLGSKKSKAGSNKKIQTRRNQVAKINLSKERDILE
jgi:hypothetical protein